jgi:hypothetical protein
LALGIPEGLFASLNVGSTQAPHDHHRALLMLVGCGGGEQLADAGMSARR